MPPIGFIRVQAVTSQAEVPVEGATVSVSGTNNAGGRELLSLQRTDESGLTDMTLMTHDTHDTPLSSQL